MVHPESGADFGRIIGAEDNDSNRELVETVVLDTVNEMGGHANVAIFKTLRDVQHALEDTTQEKVSLVVCDLALSDSPWENTLDTLQQWRAQYPETGIVVVATEPFGKGKNELDKLGADFVKKPFDVDQLQDVIRKKLQPPTE
jgi:DNA-binding NtrC family response regulator